METMPEVVVATIPEQVVIDQQERQQTTENKVLASRAAALVISNDDQYREAGEFGKEIKRRQKMVSELFAPIKQAANKAHKAACDREKEMLLPLNQAETAIKRAMGAYAMEQERKRREAEEAARRRAEEEARRLLEEAQKQEEQGNKEASAMALEEAVVMAETPVVAAAPAPAAKGVTQKKAWDIVVENPQAVPVEVMGVVIRPVDEAAIKKLVCASKGAIRIPGIKVIEKMQTILRT